MRVILCTLLMSVLSLHALADNEVYDRVMKAQTIKCGYLIYPPAIIKDPNTGELSGVFHDFMEEIVDKLSMKVEWVEEAGWSTFLNDLKNNRYDMMCGTAWKNSARGRVANPIDSLYYSAVTTWVREDDNRFKNGYTQLNDKQYKLAAIDGSTADFIVDSDFSKAEKFSLGELVPYSDMALAVTTKKADATFLEQYVAELFQKTNPDTIKQIGNPLRFYGNSMWVKKGERDFEIMINTAIEELLNSGELEKLFTKYDIPEGAYLPPASPYTEGR